MSTKEERERERLEAQKKEQEKNKKLKSSIQFMNLVTFFREIKAKEPKRCEIGIFDAGYIVTRIRYGKARIEVFYKYDEFGAIESLVVELKDVYEKYLKDKCDGYYNFIDALNCTERKFIAEDDWEPRDDFGTMDVVRTSTSNNPNIQFSDYVHWGAALYDLIGILNKLTGMNVKQYSDNEILDILGKESKRRSLKILIISTIVVIGGVALIALGINKTIAPFLGWLFGIIILLAGLFGELVGSIGFAEAKQLKNNTLHLKNQEMKSVMPNKRG